MRISLIIESTLAIGAIISMPAFSDVPPNETKEVSHLIQFVQNSGCTINRNGTEYSAEKGLSHINRKYKHYRDDISSTEDFIKYAATKSTMSGQYYTAKCPGQDIIKTNIWLTEELHRYRGK